ncbi:alanine dehydrogenase [Cellulomonas shaoxiangyii]|uniref:Alanine dehydrogenase n=1 Tax=Cellulomonas shaoxiangyii TaxID=2566013 RepID=A0A4P7SHF2_9CELL|nr:alanine dehydrogenase [Cellulomonas shaoxiangyii]QCB93442.1 alanine dehydrogenase [Cellulomonas shaoxiangyii]TGY84559.1 alanine dehydrogenase [Cellulomonas shaoxiangyii]
MQVGIPREVKNQEHRVAVTPAGVDRLVRAGHEVLVETGAGAGSRLDDADYVQAGARIVPTAADAWSAALVCKVKEPVAQEYGYLRADLVLFTYLHLAADRPATDALLAAGTTAIAYETVQAPDGSLPLLAPMSEVAGRLATQVGAYHLMRGGGGGRGVLLGGVPGTAPAKVVVLGGGVVGSHAAEIAVGMRADVTVLDLSVPRLRGLDARFGGSVRTLASSVWTLERELLDADLVVGAVLRPGARAPHLVSTELVAAMRAGSVLVDVAVDQGGCFADTRPTTHDDPTFGVHESVFYCVANMPGAVPVTSTRALTNVTLPYLGALADRGWRGAVAADPSLAAGLTTHAGLLCSAAVADAHGLPATPVGALVDGPPGAAPSVTMGA